MNSLILCKLPILFSAVKLKLGHKFSSIIRRFKILSLEFWLDFHVFPNSQRDFGIFECYSSAGFEHKTMLYLQIFPNSRKSREMRFFQSPWLHILLNCQARYVCRKEGNPSYYCQFSRKRNVHISLVILCQFK